MWIGIACAAAVVTGCSGSDAGPAAVIFDPCAPLGLAIAGTPTQPQSDGVAAAVALWNTMGRTRLTASAGPDAPAIPVHFQFAASPDHGLYDGQLGVIFVNDDLTGEPLAVTLAHELGHAFGLVHVDPAARSSVMNPGNQSTPPTPADAGELAALWSRCAPLDPAPAQ